MKYTLDLAKESLPTYCERVARHWATKSWIYDGGGHAGAMRYKSVRAFKDALRDGGLTDVSAIHQAYLDTVAMAKLILNSHE